jgi:hypothetical protein
MSMENKHTCDDCKDSGVLDMGSDVQTTTFCECDFGSETFIAWADAQSQMEFECYEDPDWQ